MGKPYVLSDYKSQAFTATAVSYTIGTAITAPFMSEHTLILATEDCLIKINDDSLWIFYHKDVYYEMFRKIVRLTVKRDTASGTLEIWSEGNIKT